MRHGVPRFSGGLPADIRRLRTAAVERERGTDILRLISGRGGGERERRRRPGRGREREAVLSGEIRRRSCLERGEAGRVAPSVDQKLLLAIGCARQERL